MRILFVEDDRRLAEAFAALAAHLGHQAEVAHDGRTAQALAQTHIYDVIFLDIGLPDIHGHELCRQLRAESANDRTCVVAITGRHDLSQFELEPFDGYLLKPVTREALEDAIKNS